MNATDPASSAASSRSFPWAGYLLALVASAGTLIIRLQMTPWVGERPLLILFLLPVVLSAYAYGFGPGIFATVLGGLGTAYYVLAPKDSFAVEAGPDLLPWLILLGTSALVSVLFGERHQARKMSDDGPRHGRLKAMERRVRWSFGFALICLIGIGLLCYLSVARMSGGMAAVIRCHDIIHTMDSLASHMVSAQNAQRGYTLTGEDYYTGVFEETAAKSVLALESLVQLAREAPHLQPRVGQLGPLLLKRFELAREVIEIRRSQGLEAARSAVEAGAGYGLQKKITDTLTGLVHEEHTRLLALEREAVRDAALTKITLVAGSAVAFLLVALALYAMGRDFAGSRRFESELQKAHSQLETRVLERTRELELANEELIASKMHLRTVTDTARVGLVIIDENHQYRYANRAYSEILNLPLIELEGRRIAEVLPSVYESLIRPKLERAFAGERTNYEMKLPLAGTASEHIYAVSYEPGTDQSGKIVVVVIVDITERKMADEMRERQRRRVAMLAEISRRLVLADSPDSLLNGIFSALADEIGAEVFFNYMVSNDANRIVLRESRGLDSVGIARFASLQFGEGLCGWIADNREPLNLGSLQSSTWEVARSAREMGLTSCAGYPLLAGGRLIGTLVFASTTRNAFFDEELQLMRAVSDQVATAVERKRLIVELAESEARFREMTQSLPLLVWTCREDGNCDFLSKQWMEYTGREEAEQLGFDWAEMIHPEDRERTLVLWKEVAVTGKHFNAEYRIRRHDGTYRWFKARAVAYRDAGGRIVKWFGSNMDIEDLIHAEAALRDREQRLQLVVNQLEALVWTADPDLRMSSIAGAGLKAANTGPEDIVGRTLFELLPASDETTPMIVSHREALLGNSSSYETSFSGRDFRASVAPFRDAAGTVVGVVGLAMDITEQKRAEAAVKEGEIFNREVIDSLTAHLAVLDREGRIVIVNEAWMRHASMHIAGGGESFIGVNYLEVCARAQAVDNDDVAGKVLDGIRAVMDGRLKYFGMEYPCHSPEHKTWFQLHVCPLTAGSSAVVTAHEDITSRKLAEESIQSMNQQLEERVSQRTKELQSANKELESFSYSVSHDLRAPLRAVDGFSQAVLEDFGSVLPPDGKRYLATIRAGAQRMGALIDDLLTFSRLSRADLNSREVDTASLVRSVLVDLEHMREGRQVAITVGELPPSHGDPALLRQVWINLLSNALKYTRKREAAVIEVGWVAGEKPAFFVKDNGSGFDMRFAHKLFGVFQRLHRAEEFEGTGVGLAIVQRIVHRHGGDVWAHAEVDRGATFCFNLSGVPKHE